MTQPRAHRAAVGQQAHAGRALPREAGAPGRLAQRGHRRPAAARVHAPPAAPRAGARRALPARAPARAAGAAQPGRRTPITCTRCCALPSNVRIIWGCTCRGSQRDALPHARWLLGSMVRLIGERERPATQSMKRSRVLVVLHPSLMPPDSLEGQDPKAIEEWRTEFDVIQTLQAPRATKCARWACSTASPNCAPRSPTGSRTSSSTCWRSSTASSATTSTSSAFLEMLRQPYTGCNPRGLLLSRDKALCKQVFAFHRIPTPQFQVFRRGQRVSDPAPAALSAVREIQHRRCLAGHRAGVGGGRRRAPEGAHRVRARAAQVRRAGRGIHRGPRAVRGHARQRSASRAFPCGS